MFYCILDLLGLPHLFARRVASAMVDVQIKILDLTFKNFLKVEFVEPVNVADMFLKTSIVCGLIILVTSILLIFVRSFHCI